MNTRRNPNYPFSKRNYNKGSSMLFKPLERAARMADAEIKKSRKKTSYNKGVSQARTKEEKETINKKGWNTVLVVFVYIVLSFAIGIPTGLFDSIGGIVLFGIGGIVSIIIGSAIPTKD